MSENIKKKIIPENEQINGNNEEKNKNDNILNKLDILIINNGWNDKNEKLIVGLGYNAGIYKQLHEQTASKYNYYNKILTLSLLIFSVFLSADSIINLLNGSVLIIVQKIIIFIIAIISIFNNFLKYGELATEHIHSASSFNIIYNNIRNTMCIYRKDRQNALQYIQDIMKQYDYLEINSPQVPNSLIQKMDKKIKTNIKYQNSNITMPTDQFREIEVNGSIDKTTYRSLDNSEKGLSDFKINNMANIEKIYQCFAINGDLSEHDNITINDIQQSKILDSKIESNFAKYHFEHSRLSNMMYIL